MIALLILTAATVTLVGAVFDLWEDVDEILTDIDEADGFSLLDETLPDALVSGPLAEIEQGAEVLNAELEREDYGPTGAVEIDGTDGDDLIDAGTDVEVAFGAGGNDVIFGADHDQVIFGDDGDDLVFAEGGADQVHGDEGDDTLVGGDGSDLIVGGQGADVLFGGAGDDTLFTAHLYATDIEPGTFDAVSAGDGDDAVYVTQGAALIELGAGADDVLVYSEFGIEDNDPVAIITDFDGAEDQIILGVHVAEFEFAEGTSTLEIGFVTEEIDTPQGPATLVIPAVDNEDLAAQLRQGSIGHAVLVGVTPDQIAEDDIRVIITSDTSPSVAADSIQQIFAAQSVGSGL